MKEIHAFIGDYPEIAFSIFENFSYSIAREAIRHPVVISNSVMNAIKALSLSPDPQRMMAIHIELVRPHHRTIESWNYIAAPFPVTDITDAQLWSDDIQSRPYRPAWPNGNGLHYSITSNFLQFFLKIDSRRTG